MEKVKVYLDEARNACVVCGNCGKFKEISFANREVPRSSMVKCSCGSSFIVSFEKRIHYRKALDLKGKCFTNGNPAKSDLIRIMDVSIGGVQFQAPANGAYKFDQKLGVAFSIDNQSVNMIVAVRYIQGLNVGTEVTSIDGHSKKIIGFYLLP